MVKACYIGCIHHIPFNLQIPIQAHHAVHHPLERVETWEDAQRRRIVPGAMILQAIGIQRFASERHRVAERPVLTLHHTVLGEVPRRDQPTAHLSALTAERIQHTPRPVRSVLLGCHHAAWIMHPARTRHHPVRGVDPVRPHD